MNWEYKFKYERDLNGNLSKLVPTKCLKSDTGEVLAQVDVSTVEYAENISNIDISEYFSSVKTFFSEELDRILGYDSESPLENKGIENSYVAYPLGVALSAAIEVGAHLIRISKAN